MAYCTASGISNSPRGDGRMARHAAKIEGPNRQQFMLSQIGRGMAASVASSGFSMICSKQPRPSIFATANRLIRSSGTLLPASMASRSNRATAQPDACRSAAERLDRIIGVGIDDHERFVAGERLGGGHGVGRAAGLPLAGESESGAARRPPARV